jgi:hypothetical protein
VSRGRCHKGDNVDVDVDVDLKNHGDKHDDNSNYKRAAVADRHRQQDEFVFVRLCFNDRQHRRFNRHGKVCITERVHIRENRFTWNNQRYNYRNGVVSL